MRKRRFLSLLFFYERCFSACCWRHTRSETQHSGLAQLAGVHHALQRLAITTARPITTNSSRKWNVPIRMTAHPTVMIPSPPHAPTRTAATHRRLQAHHRKKMQEGHPAAFPTRKNLRKTSSAKEKAFPAPREEFNSFPSQRLDHFGKRTVFQR